jgi:hypothetical protein
MCFALKSLPPKRAKRDKKFVLSNSMEFYKTHNFMPSSNPLKKLQKVLTQKLLKKQCCLPLLFCF